ncbi:unnamed protein product [Symbiodinium natans]|uniref:Uncharacterized protein n=1 Tax=Symbiodinium natans TaxID=878477 RepID=A0A812UNN3_9DINO|nr:unnamed protein product [Symbiodinium natans]
MQAQSKLVSSGGNFWKKAKSCTAASSCDVALDAASCLEALDSVDSKGAVGGRRVGGGQQAWWFRERESSLSFLLCTALWQEMIGSAVQSEYRSYAKFITKTGCNSVSSCKDRVTGGLDEAWNVVYDTMQNANSGIGSLIARGTEKFGDSAKVLMANAKKNTGTTATSEVRSFFNGVVGQFQKHDLGQVCTPSGVGFWYLVPTDCGFFSKFGDVFNSPSAAQSNWNEAVDRLQECVMKTGAFSFPTPFLDFRVNSFCLPTVVQTPIEYILGVFKFATNTGASLISHFETIAAKIQGLISSSGLNFNQTLGGNELDLQLSWSVKKSLSRRLGRVAYAQTCCKLFDDARGFLILQFVRASTRASYGDPWQLAGCLRATYVPLTTYGCDLSSTCSCNGIVRYGFADKWLLREVTGSVQCSNSVFGDPYSGQAKECQCVDFSEIPWSRCACQEKGHPTNPDCLLSNTCQCDGMVRFGYGDKWYMQPVSGSTSCSGSIFGDPYPGQGKECHCMNRNAAQDKQPNTFGLQVVACFDWSFVAFTVSVCVGLLFGEKDGNPVIPNLVMDIEFGSTSFVQQALEAAAPETGFSLLFEYKEEYPAFLPASEPRWGVSASVDVSRPAGRCSWMSNLKDVLVMFRQIVLLRRVKRIEQLSSMPGLAEVGAGVGVSFLPDPNAAKGYVLTLALGQDEAGEEANQAKPATLLDRMRSDAQDARTRARQDPATAEHAETAALLAAVSHMASSSDFDRMLQRAVPKSEQLVQAMASAARNVPPKLDVSVSSGLAFSFCLTPPKCQGQ